MLPIMSAEMRLASDVELRFTPSGAAVCNMRLVASKRKQDETTGEWVDVSTCWLSASCWRDLAEHCAESLRKGDLVEVRGALSTREYEVDGVKRTSVDLDVYSIGPSLRFRDILHSDGQGGKVTREGASPTGPDPASDPWATPASDVSEPPF